MKIYRHWSKVFALCCVTSLLAAITASAQIPASDSSSTKGDDKPTVTYFSAAQVDASFAKGVSVLSPGPKGGNFIIMTAQRSTPGLAEFHGKYADVIYVVEGTATLITGGEIIGGKTTAPDEIRGESIKGGESRKLAKGDVVIIPNGIPHQFLGVTAPFLYYVVKVK
jgi:mannose-6-phosphate isomerase-like protein (cupin superfamily)